MRELMKKPERLLALGGTKKDVILLVLSGAALIVSLARADVLPFDAAWVAIVLRGIPISLEAIIGLAVALSAPADRSRRTQSAQGKPARLPYCQRPSPAR